MPSEALIERYRNAAISLLPPGRAFSKSLAQNVSKLLEALSVEWARIHEDAETFYENIFPNSSDAYLADWEEALDLPGKCVSSPGSVSERQGAVIAKLRGRTSHAQAAFEAAAEALGYDDLEFVRYPPFTAGSVAGQAVYGDEWAHVVRVYVLDGDQTASDTLICLFVDELRRSHGFIDVVLEGPMGAEREAHGTYMNPATQSSSPLASDAVLADIEAISIRFGGYVSIQCKIDDGSGGAPSDTPVGAWELYSSVDGINYSKVSAADAELAKIAPNGNNVVEAFALLSGVPGTSIKIAYNRTSGGAGNSRVRMQVATW